MSTTDPKDELEAVNRELAEVKKQLAIYQAAVGDLSKTDDEHVTRSTSGFLDLPRQLRDTIYELCVVPGKVYIFHANIIKTYDMRITAQPRPEFQVFRVCKQIFHEAHQLFVDKNIFVLTVGPVTELSALRAFLRSVGGSTIRRLSISFDYRDYAACAIVGRGTMFARKLILERRYDDEMDHLHILRSMWHDLETKIYYGLVEMIGDLRLTYLQNNLQKCLDPTGTGRGIKKRLDRRCLRRTPEDPGDLGKDRQEDRMTITRTSIMEAQKELNVKNIDFVGTVDKNERDYLRRKLAGTKANLLFHGVNMRASDGVHDDWDENQRILDYAEAEEQGMMQLLADKNRPEVDEARLLVYWGSEKGDGS